MVPKFVPVIAHLLGLLFQVNLAFKMVADEDLPTSLTTVDGKEPATFSFEDFCCLVAEFKFKVRFQS